LGKGGDLPAQPGAEQCQYDSSVNRLAIEVAVAEDKNKKEDEKSGKKKGLPALVLVAVGAALGGAGTVVMVPKQDPVSSNPAPQVPKKVFADVEEAVEHSFNPRATHGSAMASVKFKFNYVTLEQDREEARELVKRNWDRMTSRVLLLLSAQTPEQIKDSENSLHLEKQLREVMTLALFPPEEGEKAGIAVVKEILWMKKVVQK